MTLAKKRFHLPSFCLTSAHAQQIGGAEVIRTNFVIREYNIFGKLRARDMAVGWEILHPAPREHHSRSDDDATVARKKINSWTVLSLSRLGREGQDSLLAANQNLRSDIVIAGLPERDETLCEPLLDATNPKIIIIVDSQTPATRRAPEKLRNRLGRRPLSVFEPAQVTSVYPRTPRELRQRPPMSQALLLQLLAEV